MRRASWTLLLALAASAAAQEGAPPQVPPAESVAAELPEEDIAFRLRIEGVEGEPLVVPLKEWDEYTRYLQEIYQPAPGDTSFLYGMLMPLIEAKMMEFLYAKKRPELLARAQEILGKLEGGARFERMARLYSEDATSRSAGGSLGLFTRSIKRYPLEHTVFELDEGQYGGPYVTRYGVEIFHVDRRIGERHTLSEKLEVSYILLKWDQGMSKEEWARLRRNVRVSTSHEKFRAFLPPAWQEPVPAAFGPTDIAPPGSPAKALAVIRYESGP